MKLLEGDKDGITLRLARMFLSSPRWLGVFIMDRTTTDDALPSIYAFEGDNYGSTRRRQRRHHSPSGSNVPIEPKAAWVLLLNH
jgi:hypothetical protein